MLKQVIAVRKDLAMSPGKLASQCSHASVSAFETVRRSQPEIARAWQMEGQKKIILKVSGEMELLDYYQRVKSKKIPCELIRDAGRTQLEPGTLTCFGAGPWDEKELDEIFGKLKLL
jgi:PTH2 family peptidyl-tRNA hydrolase